MVSIGLSNKNTRWLFYLSCIALVAFVLSACAPYQARKKGVHFKETGDASWYGPGFVGRRTASGERYNQNGLTAAHKTLPMGTLINVTNIDNGKSVIVRVNDRGPFVRGRIVDLSKGAAKRIDMLGTGTAPVELIALSAPLDAMSADGTVKSEANSEENETEDSKPKKKRTKKGKEDEDSDDEQSQNGVSYIIDKESKSGAPYVESTETAKDESEAVDEMKSEVKKGRNKKAEKKSSPKGSKATTENTEENRF